MCIDGLSALMVINRFNAMQSSRLYILYIYRIFYLDCFFFYYYFNATIRCVV